MNGAARTAAGACASAAVRRRFGENALKSYSVNGIITDEVILPGCSLDFRQMEHDQQYQRSKKMSIRIGILGYGNLGRGVECAIRQNSDMQLAAVFTRRAPGSVKLLTEVVPV